MNRTESSTMSSSHVLVQRFYSQCTGCIAVFLVHVVGTRTRIISKPDTVVLDSQWPLLRDLISSKQTLPK